MKRRILLFTAVLVACGGDGSTSPPGGSGLAPGLYAAYRPISAPVWTVSWPVGITRTDCAQLGSDNITIIDGSTFSETRTYSTPPGVGTFFTTQQTFTGTYVGVVGSNSYYFTVDGGTDIAVAQTSSVDPSRAALVFTRNFPLRGACLFSGPYTIEYIK